MRGLAHCNLATYPPPLQTYAVMVIGLSFTGVYHAEDAAVQFLDNFEKMDTTVTMNQLKVLQRLYEPALLQRVAPVMSRPKTNIKEVQDRAAADQLALMSRSGQRHPSISKRLPLTSK